MGLNISSIGSRNEPIINIATPSAGALSAGGSNTSQVATPLRKTNVGLAINPEPVLHVPAVIDANKDQNIRNAIEQINTVLKDGGRGISFVIDRSLSTPIVQVTRDDTGEVLNQYPNEAIIRVAHNIEKLKGVLFHGLI